MESRSAGSVAVSGSAPVTLWSAAHNEAHDNALHTRCLLRLDEIGCVGNLPNCFVWKRKKKKATEKSKNRRDSLAKFAISRRIIRVRVLEMRRDSGGVHRIPIGRPRRCASCPLRIPAPSLLQLSRDRRRRAILPRDTMSSTRIRMRSRWGRGSCSEFEWAVCAARGQSEGAQPAPADSNS